MVIVCQGVEDHRAKRFVSLALKVQALASALVSSVQALALALSVRPWPSNFGLDYNTDFRVGGSGGCGSDDAGGAGLL